MVTFQSTSVSSSLHSPPMLLHIADATKMPHNSRWVIDKIEIRNEKKNAATMQQFIATMITASSLVTLPLQKSLHENCRE